MIDKKLNERQKKFEEIGSSSNMTKNNLMKRREVNNLNLRKEKLYDTIMQKRMKGLRDKGYNCESNPILNSEPLNESYLNSPMYTEIELNIQLIDIPKVINKSFDTYQDKLVLISKFLSQQYEDEPESKEFHKFAIYQMRIYIKDRESIKDEEMDLIILNIYPYLEKYLLDKINLEEKDKDRVMEYIRIKYEVTWVLIDLISKSDEVGNKMLNVVNLNRLEEILDECVEINNKYKINTILLIKHIFWIFANLLIQDKQSNQIVKNSIKIKEMLNKYLDQKGVLLNFDGPEEMKLDLLPTLLWTTQTFLEFTFSDVFSAYKEILSSVINLTTMALINYRNNTKHNTINFKILEEGIDVISKYQNCSQVIPVMIDKQIIPLLIASLNTFCENQQTSQQIHKNLQKVVKIFIELSTGSDSDVTFMLNYPVLDNFIEILFAIDSRTSEMVVEDNPLLIFDTQLAKEILLCISNICASTEDNVDRIISNKKLISLLLSLYNKFEMSVKMEILYIFYNAFHMGSNFTKTEIITLQIHRYFLSKIMETYEQKGTKAAYLQLLLKGIEEFLNYGEKLSSKMNVIKAEFEQEGIVSAIDKLQWDSRQEIYDIATTVYHRYWGENENYYSGPHDFYIK